MSYCRWSSDDHQSDAYVWHDVSGTWRTEVAGRRPVFDQPMPPTVDLPVGEANSPERDAWATAWIDRNQAVREIMGDPEEWTWVDVPEAPGGTSYTHRTPGECADNLERLQQYGIQVPASAIAGLRQEAEGASR